MNIEKVRNYAKLIARSGLNIQKGQDVFLRADIEILDFVRILVEELYDAGAQYVDIEWTDNEITKTRIAKSKTDNSTLDIWLQQLPLETRQKLIQYQKQGGKLEQKVLDRLNSKQQFKNGGTLTQFLVKEGKL